MCPHYERGFCKLGTRCAKRHTKTASGRGICGLYMAGFCPYGRACVLGVHAKWKDDADMPEHEVRVVRSAKEVELERERMRGEAEERDAREWERGDGGKGRGRGKRGFGRGRRGGY